MPQLNQAFAKAYGAELPGYAPNSAPATAVAAPPVATMPARDVRQVTNRAAILPLSAVTEAAPAPRAFQALLQIERCLWPETVLRLAASNEAWSQLEAELHQMIAQRRTLIGVTSPTLGAGCTTLVQTLARRFGQAGVKVAAIDAHFSRPALARGWQILPQLGWEHMLRGEMGLDEVLIESTADQLTILPLKASPEDLPALVSSSRFELGLRMLRQNFPLTLIDLGPVQEPLPLGFEALLATELLEAAILVHDARHPDTPALRRAQEQLAAQGVHWTAVAENFVGAGEGE